MFEKLRNVVVWLRLPTICNADIAHTAKWLLSVTAIALVSCVHGIPPPDGFEPKPAKPCHIVVTDGDRSVCMTRSEFERWRKQWGL